MPGKAKRIIAAVLLLVLITVVTGYYLWNKPHKNVSDADGIKIEAAALYKTFTGDSVMAKKNYVQQVVEVNGVINAISKNQQSQTVVTLGTATEGAYINCTMEGEANGLKQDSEIIIKGICEGIGQGDAGLGIPGDVYLTRCYIIK